MGIGLSRSNVVGFIISWLRFRKVFSQCSAGQREEKKTLPRTANSDCTFIYYIEIKWKTAYTILLT